MDNKENIVVKPEMPMKWFKFYKVLLIIWIVGYLIYGIGSVVLAVKGDGEFAVPAGIYVGFAVFSLALGALCIYLFLGLHKFNLRAYKVNIWFIIILGIFGAAGCGAVVVAVLIYGIGIVGAAAIGVAYSLVALIYPYCSIIYFEKRKFMFSGEKKEECEPSEEPETFDMFAALKTSEASETAENSETESKVPAKKLTFRMKYLIAHVIVSLMVITMAAVRTPADLGEYADDDLMQGSEISLEKAEGKYDEVVTDDEQIKKAFDEIAVFVGYTDSDELMTEVETIEKEFDNEIDLHGMELKEAYEFIFTEYFAVPSYEDALFSVNPYTEEVITSFIEYQDYVMMEIESYYEM